jgi:alcohol dehydrogenase (cytochrome c)
VVTVILLSWDLHAQLPYKRLVDAAQEPQNWLMYSGTYSSNRYSLLREIDATNAKALDLKWVFQAQSLNSFEATPLVVDGVMYLTQAPNDVVALDSKTGRIFWIYRHVNSSTPSPVVVLSIAGW